MGSNLSLRGFGGGGGDAPQENVEIWSALAAILGLFYAYLGLTCVASQTYSLLTKTWYIPLRGGGTGPPDPLWIANVCTVPLTPLDRQCLYGTLVSS